jgi:hypothetical protein
MAVFRLENSARLAILGLDEARAEQKSSIPAARRLRHVQIVRSQTRRPIAAPCSPRQLQTPTGQSSAFPDTPRDSLHVTQRFGAAARFSHGKFRSLAARSPRTDSHPPESHFHRENAGPGQPLRARRAADSPSHRVMAAPYRVAVRRANSGPGLRARPGKNPKICANAGDNLKKHSAGGVFRVRRRPI